MKLKVVMSGGLRICLEAVRAPHRPSVARKTCKPENRDGAASPTTVLVFWVTGLLGYCAAGLH